MFPGDIPLQLPKGVTAKEIQIQVNDKKVSGDDIEFQIDLRLCYQGK